MVSAGLQARMRRGWSEGCSGCTSPPQGISWASTPLHPPPELTMPGLGSAPRRPVLLLLLLLLLVVPGRPGGREGA